MEGYKEKRESPEWICPIVKIILRHGNYANYDTLYAEIPTNIDPPLTEYEKRLSGKENPEYEWRGTLRGYLSDLVKDGTLRKDIGSGNRRWFSVINPDEWSFLLG